MNFIVHTNTHSLLLKGRSRVNNYYFTSESVTEGHPDKLCDQIADRILDELLAKDPLSRCACEVAAERDAIHIMGEITTQAAIDYKACARSVIGDIGYTDPQYGFTNGCKISCSLHQQSIDIAMGVDSAADDANELGAGDQGMMFGYACDETESCMPLAIYLANALTKHLAQLRKNNVLRYLRPDGKSQITVEYEKDIPKRVDTVVIATQHDPHINLCVLRKDIEEKLIHAVVPAKFLDNNTKIYINPTGRFALGGPAADTGLTGRKIIADTYGGYARHGGGAFSGKDPTKVDRSAAYMARYVAKHIITAGLAKKCEIQLGYAIGIANPVSVYINTFGTGAVSDDSLVKWIGANIDLRPSAIIKVLQLRTPIYAATAAYGHFGRAKFPWEKIDNALISSLKSLL